MHHTVYYSGQHRDRTFIHLFCYLFIFLLLSKGLVTLNDMKAKQEALVKEREKQLAKKEQSKELQL